MTMAVMLAALAVALFLPHIKRGGFYADDWPQSSAALFHTYGPLNFLLPSSLDPGNRPLLLLYLSVIHAILGLHQHAYLAFMTVAVIGQSLVLFLVLRMIRLERLHAGMIAMLVLLFPYADTTHLWFQGAAMDMAITLYLLGVATALRGLDRKGRAALGYHLGALGLYAASLLIYEITAIAIMATGALYWWYAGRRAALHRWVADVAVTLVLLAIFTRNTGIPRLHGLSAVTAHAHVIYDQLLTLFAHTVFPLNASPTLVLVLAALLLVGAREVSWRLPSDDPARTQLKRWIRIVLVGLVMAAVAGTIYAPAVPYYSPLVLGIGNRVNALPAIGLVIAAYGIYMVAGILVRCIAAVGRREGGRVTDLRLASVVAVVLASLTGVRFAHLVRTDIGAYDVSSRYQLQILDALHTLVPRPPRNDTLFAFGFPAYTAPGVPVFAASWDLNGAVQVSYHDPTLNAYSMLPGDTLACTARGVVPTIEQTPSNILIRYDHVILFDYANNRITIPRTKAQCLSALPTFAPGPLTILPAPAV